MRSDIVFGGPFPDYELRDHTGARRRLSELQGADPMVLVLSRGSFCPKDREQHRLLAGMERAVQRDLDIVEYTDPQHNPMIPHTLVLEPGLVVYSVYNGYWYWGRPSPAELRADLRAVTEKVRPDWDITAPGLREEWEHGDKGAFWPYGKTLSQVFAEDRTAD
jgi:hypothetical protein